MTGNAVGEDMLTVFAQKILKVLVIGDFRSGKSAFIAAVMERFEARHRFEPTMEVMYWRKELEGGVTLLIVSGS